MSQLDPLLSICIPTYNYGSFIGQALDSILAQLAPEVEVIVLDGGSTDNTEAEVRARQSGCASLIYFRQEFRGGIDRDIETVVGMARGEYCWLFSADDVMRPGAIKQVLAAMQSQDDVYICEHVLCDIDMSPVGAYPPFNGIKQARTFDLGDRLQRLDYFRLARTSEAFFSFLAGPIFKKKVWDGAVVPDSFRGTCWIVAGHLLSMIPQGITVRYLCQVMVHKREGNDSFSGGSLIKRCKIGIQNFQHVGDQIFGKSSYEARHIRRVLHRDVPWFTLLHAKMQAAESADREGAALLRRLVAIHYADQRPDNWIKRALYHALTPPMLRFAYRIKQFVRNLRSGQ